MIRNKKAICVMIAGFSIMNLVGCGDKNPPGEESSTAMSVLENNLSYLMCHNEKVMTQTDAQKENKRIDEKFKLEAQGLTKKLALACSPADIDLLGKSRKCYLEACLATSKHEGDSDAYLKDLYGKEKEKQCSDRTIVKAELSTNECWGASYLTAGTAGSSSNKISQLFKTILNLQMCINEKTLEEASAKAENETLKKDFAEKQKQLNPKIRQTCTDAEIDLAIKANACAVEACKATGDHKNDLAGYKKDADKKMKEKKCDEIKSQAANMTCADAINSI